MTANALNCSKALGVETLDYRRQSTNAKPVPVSRGDPLAASAAHAVTTSRRRSSRKTLEPREGERIQTGTVGAVKSVFLTVMRINEALNVPHTVGSGRMSLNAFVAFLQTGFAMPPSVQSGLNTIDGDLITDTIAIDLLSVY